MRKLSTFPEMQEQPVGQTINSFLHQKIMAIHMILMICLDFITLTGD